MMRCLKRRCSFALILILASAAAQAFDSQQVLGYLQRLQASSGAPGVSAAVAVDGAIVFSGGVGVADVQSAMPQNGRSVHNIGSISKTQAVVAILQLVEQGKIDLDARVQKYLPWFPEKQEPVTLRAILTHTSGIRHYKDGEFGPTNVLSFRHYDVFEESTRFWRDDPLVFEPGQYWRYSSFATNLLHGVIEAASGQGFEEYLREHVWEPSGMLETQFDVPSRIVPRRGRGYVRNEKTGVLENAQDENVSYKYAGGGVISTNKDMCRFAVALSAGRLLSTKSMAEMYRLQLRPDTPYTPEDAKAFEPGKAPPSMGLSQALIWQMQKDELGRVYASHSGTLKGTRSMLSNFKDAGVVVSLHINALPIDVDISDAAEALAQLFLADAPAAKGSRPKRD